METLGFKRLKIHGWRQFQSIEFDVHPRLTVITGANGSGKSTLLNIFSQHFGYQRPLLAIPQSKEGVVTFAFGLFDILKRRNWCSVTLPPPFNPG